MRSSIAAAAMVAALVAGCAGDQRTFYSLDEIGRAQPGNQSPTWAKDTYECRRDVMTSAVGFSRSVTAPYYAERMLIDCMIARGYVYR